ncbi:MAG: glycosyltransferase [Clostridia bacterium]|nr:glycosyltransferase [Clostridia bacterium]
MKLITVFTPTYNREKTLSKCYESLLAQTSNNFIWQVIDDGSTDNTEDLIKSFIEEDKIEISYFKKPNGGKVSAINKSLDLTQTDLWVCLDSDDYFLADAVSTYERLFEEIKDKDEICGLFSVRSTSKGTPMTGFDVPDEIRYETQFNIRYKYKVEPEYVQVYKTKIAAQYKYPLFDGEKYVPLSYTQDQIDQKYKFKIFHEPTMVCEYQPDGITRNHRKLIKRNPRGYTEFKRQQIELAPDLLFRLKACISYDAGCIMCGDMKRVFSSPNRLLTGILFPLGWLAYMIRYKNV